MRSECQQSELSCALLSLSPHKQQLPAASAPLPRRTHTPPTRPTHLDVRHPAVMVRLPLHPALEDLACACHCTNVQRSGRERCLSVPAVQAVHCVSRGMPAPAQSSSGGAASMQRGSSSKALDSSSKACIAGTPSSRAVELGQCSCAGSVQGCAPLPSISSMWMYLYHSWSMRGSSDTA